MGRINLVKMVLLPKLLYLFWHAPLYIPAHMFRNMESILNTFVWGSSGHKLAWQTLKRPVHLGGTALPDLALYYLASQLSHFYYFNRHDKIRYSMLVCMAATDLVAHPFQILFCKHHGLSRLGDRRHMLAHHSKIWHLALNITGAPLCTLTPATVGQSSPLGTNDHSRP